MCIYQHHGFHEGMHIYNEIMHAKDVSSDNLRHNVLLYNTGQLYIRCMEYDKARRKFERSLVLLAKYKEGGTTTPNSMKLKHNIGVCYYRLGKKNLHLNFIAVLFPMQYIDLLNLIWLLCAIVLQFFSFTILRMTKAGHWS